MMVRMYIHIYFATFQNTRNKKKYFAWCNSVWFAYHHGLVDDILWQSLLENCCHLPYDRFSCDFGDTASAPDTVACEYDVAKVQEVVFNGNLNWYNIYGDCFTTVEEIIEQGL